MGDDLDLSSLEARLMAHHARRRQDVRSAASLTLDAGRFVSDAKDDPRDERAVEPSMGGGLQPSGAGSHVHELCVAVVPGQRGVPRDEGSPLDDAGCGASTEGGGSPEHFHRPVHLDSDGRAALRLAIAAAAGRVDGDPAAPSMVRDDASLETAVESWRARRPPPAARPAVRPVEQTASSFVPFRAWASSYGTSAQRARAAASVGRRELLLGTPPQWPADFMPKVHGVSSGKGGPEEVTRRLRASAKLVTVIPDDQWPDILEKEPAAVSQMSAAALLRAQLTRLCRVAGHERLDYFRTTIYGLAADVAAADGVPLTVDVLRSRIGADAIEDYLDNVDEEAALLRAAQRREYVGVAPTHRLGALVECERVLHFRIAATSKTLDHWRSTQRGRTPARAPVPEIGQIVHLELVAADTSQREVVRECASLAALNAHVSVRKRLSDRSDTLEDAADGEVPFGFASAGVDLKKRKWRRDGRPLICDTRGYSGSREWWVVSQSVLRRLGTSLGLLRGHNGGEGGLTSATCLVDAPPPEG